ncbi:methylglyoxal synthase [Variovorax sp. JS1663]|uniref:methylglyoxal synthase n=1 Tax=Variovorax sp. JS1663 TaxID=1851577 RepID=UPI000B3437F3|nr:methylglyoxal synthase [Variovorax sp. JS1663]OUL99280.1 methylglyoxal synthase [Variovorax sp. JS1663]
MSSTGTPPSLRFGLVASRLHRSGEQSGLAAWLRACDAGIRALGIELHAVGGTAEAIDRLGLLAGYEKRVRYPSGREGGVMRLVSRIAGGLDAADALDGVIYLIDPVDPTSLYPETLALKRQCVVHGKPFVSTVAGAQEWIAVELASAGLAVPGMAGDWRSIEAQTVALIAHDALKDRMVEFASRHFELLSRFALRVGTGTTGGRLNDMAWARGWPADRPWVQRYQSGPLGGDAQIAELVLEGRCQKAIFFEDPHVARQHEADIQLLERAVCSVTRRTTCFNSPAMAGRWAAAFSG